MTNLQKIRKEIDKIDVKLSKFLKLRAKKSHLIGVLKKEKKLKITDKNREKEIIENLETNYEKEIFKKILQQSRKIQREALTKSVTIAAIRVTFLE